MRLKFLLLSILLFFFFQASSQNGDSIQKILRTDIENSLKIDTFNQNETIWKYRRLADTYSAIGEYDSAYFYMNLYQKEIKEIYEKKLLKIQTLNQDVINKNNRIFFFIVGFVLLVVFIVLLLLLNSRRKLKKSNHLLSAKNIEIETQKANLELMNQQMFDSNIKIDQQNLEVMQKNTEIQLQSDKLTEKTIDLLVLNREIRQTAKLREGLTNMIVHDLKNPISSIINISENKEITYFAKEILTMVENILDVQKFEGMMMPLNKRDYSLKDITDSAVKQIEVFAEHKNIQIENKILKKHHVNIDEDIIRRVFVNLLSNAIKYTPANGFITIDFEIKPEKKDFILVKVIDSGIGIRKDKIDIIFNKFKQVMAKKTGLARSTGLGLTFCKMAIEAHDSKIIVDSEPGKHTTFSFDFELSKIKKTEKYKEKTIVYELETKLNQDDKLYLNRFYSDLKEFDVYEIGKLRKTTVQIDENFSIGIKKWKLELEKAIYNCNPGLYDELVSFIALD